MTSTWYDDSHTGKRRTAPAKPAATLQPKQQQQRRKKVYFCDKDGMDDFIEDDIGDQDEFLNWNDAIRTTMVLRVL